MSANPDDRDPTYGAPSHTSLEAKQMQNNILNTLNRLFPGFIRRHEGAPFVRPSWTDDNRSYADGYYWENCDGDRFYFSCAEECAEDAAQSLGLTDEELSIGAQP